MIRAAARKFLALGAAALIATGIAFAQEAEESSRFVRFIEGLISTPDRQINISGLEGTFSSSPTAERLTISDPDGPWLQIDGVQVVWNRTALFRRTLDIESLAAERVTVLRRPGAAAESEAAPEGGSGLPVDIQIDAFSLPEIVLAEPVTGAAANLSAEGSAQVTEEVVAVDLDVTRLDAPGTLSADLRLQPQDNILTAELSLAEPAGGLLADLLELRGEPAVTLGLSGTGPLSDWQADLQMDADGTRVLAGAVSIARAEDGYRITGDLTGALETIAPVEYAALVSGESQLALDVLLRDSGALSIQSVSLESQGVDLAASAELTPDRVPESAELTLRLGQAGRTMLPIVPGEMSVAGLEISAGLDSGEAAPWRADIQATGVQSAFGAIGDLALTASGQASNLTLPAERATSFRLEGSATGVAPVDEALAQALGPSVRLTGAGNWASGRPVSLENLQAVLTGATASFTGNAAAEGLDGRFVASVTDLSRFAGLAGRPLGGGAMLQATGTVGLPEGSLDLQLDGEVTDLALGVEAVDPLLAGTTRVSGGLAREGEALRFAELVLAHDAVNVTLSGSFAAPDIDLSVTASVADLSSLTPRAEGQAQLAAQITGTIDAPAIEAEASGDDIVLMGRPLSNASATFAGVVAGPETRGSAALGGELGGIPIEGSAELSAGADGARVLEDFLLTIGESRAAGALTIASDGLITGDLTVASPDLSAVAPLFLVEAEGMLRADISLSVESGAQAATISGTATDIVYENVTLGSAEISAAAQDLFNAPQIEGDFSVRDLTAGGLTIVAAEGSAERVGQATAFTVDAELADGSATVSGSLEPSGDGLALALDTFAYSRAGIDVALAAPTRILIEDGTARFDGAVVNAEGGTITIDGSAGQALDLDVVLSGVPAALANNFAPELGADGTISGTAVVTGTAAAPEASFDAAWQGASVTASRNAGLGALAIDAEGRFADGAVNLDSTIAGADGLAIDVVGDIGTAAGGTLDLSIEGSVPLSLGNPALAARGAALQGALNVDLAITGPVASPQYAGTVTAAGGGFVDPETGIVLTDLTLAASVADNQLVVNQLTAESGGGTVSASGSIGIDPAGGFPVDLVIDVNQARYVDGTLVAARFDADLTITGSLTQGPLLGGTVLIDRAEITVPEQLPRGSVAVDVEHVAPPPDVQATLARAREPGRRSGSADGGEPAGIRLDVMIDAPQQIFVRGRGLDAELGGSLTLTGPVSAIVANGEFEMQRGRLDIFTQRITFDRGILTFAGDLDPMLDFAGSTTSGDIVATVSVTGEASDPEISFSSVPELPEDEVLAYLIFNRSIDELSPLQIARLAAAAAQLAGGGGSGLLDRLRESTGLDDLDIVVDEEGGAALQAGRYISENVYIGVQQGTTAESSRVSIDLDITDDVKARATVSPEGSSSIGVFFEREY